MKKWYKKCPYCANEIKEWAVKCQYCSEFLKREREEDIEQENLDIKTWKLKWKRNLIIRIIVFVILILLGFTYKRIVGIYTDALIKRANNIENYSDAYSLLSDLDMVDSEEGKEILNLYNTNQKLQELNEEYKRKWKEIWQLYIYNLDDYKNLDVINNCLSNWDVYKTNTVEYFDNVKKLYNEVKSFENDPEISEILLGMEDMIKWADLNINFLTYMKNIQDQFYISDDWQVKFYDDEKYNEWYQVLVDFSNQSEIYNKKYAKYLN